MKAMKVACVSLIAIVAIGLAVGAVANYAGLQSFKVGSVHIAIPQPRSDMIDAGKDNYEFVRLAVPEENRLLVAFVLTNELPRLTNGATNLILTKYAMIQVSRGSETKDTDADDFTKVIDGAKKTFGDVVTSSVKEAEDDFNRRLKALGLDDPDFKLGKPVQLGCFVSTQDAYGFGLIIPVSMGTISTKMAMGGALVRVKKKVIFVYLYAEYTGSESAKSLRIQLQDWVDRILTANG